MGSKTKNVTKPTTKTKWKGKRWKKGKSSSSNPECKRFREAAKTRFFQPMSAVSGKKNISFTRLWKRLSPLAIYSAITTKRGVLMCVSY